jgi:hypothetical protein
MTIGILMAVVTVLTSSERLACPSMSIPELAARNEPVNREVTREFVPASLQEIASRAAVIVEATVRPMKTYLSPDECYVLTDYLITPRAMVAGAFPVASKPAAQPLVVTQFGGEMVINGVTVSVRDRNLPALPVDSPLILFLVPSSYDRSKFEVEGRINGAFRVDKEARVSSLMRHAPAGHSESIPVERDAFIAKVKQFRVRR